MKRRIADIAANARDYRRKMDRARRLFARFIGPAILFSHDGSEMGIAVANALNRGLWVGPGRKSVGYSIMRKLFYLYVGRDKTWTRDGNKFTNNVWVWCRKNGYTIHGEWIGKYEDQKSA